MFAMHIWHFEETIFVLSGGVLRNRDGKCREAATLQLLWGSVVASLCCWFLCIYLHCDCGHHHSKASLSLAVSFSQLPSYFMCLYQMGNPFSYAGNVKEAKISSLFLQPWGDVKLLCCASSIRGRKSPSLWESARQSVGRSTAEVLRGIPLASFLFRNLEAGGTKKKRHTPGR